MNALPVIRRIVCVAMLALASGCFFYSSAASNREEGQRTRAAQLAPELDQARPTATDESQRVLTIRAYATEAFRARTLHWTQRVRDAMDDINPMLTELGVRVVVKDAQPWKPTSSEDNLPALLRELEAHDAASDVDWVVGFVGSVPRLTDSFHDLGLAGYFSKHFVMRAANNQERHQIDEAFDALDEEERTRLYERRAAHRFASLFLHELAHTLGAPHTRNPEELMHPSYTTEVLGFGAPTMELLKLGLAARAEDDPRRLGDARNAILQFLKDHRALWSDGDELIARLEQSMTGGAASAPVASTAAAAQRGGPGPIAAVPETARADFARAHAALDDGRLDDALSIALPLAQAHPDSYPIAELLCSASMRRGLTARLVQERCQRMMELASQ